MVKLVVVPVHLAPPAHIELALAKVYNIGAAQRLFRLLQVVVVWYMLEYVRSYCNRASNLYI